MFAADFALVFPLWLGLPGGAGALLLGEAVCAGLVVAGALDAAGDGEGDACVSGTVDCRTEWDPVTAGKESINAISINAAEAPMVILARMLAVPRGPKAVLERLLEKSAPASDLPGCNNTTTTKIRQSRMNNPYKT